MFNSRVMLETLTLQAVIVRKIHLNSIGTFFRKRSAYTSVETDINLRHLDTSDFLS